MSFFSSPGLYSYIEPKEKLIDLPLRYHFRCKCFVCINNVWHILTGTVNASDDPIYDEAIEPAWMTPDDFRKLPRDEIQNYEKKGIEFLEKYNRFHPIQDTMYMQDNLLNEWIVLSSRFCN